MESRNVRDRVVIATKFTTNYKTYSPDLDRNQVVQYGGNNKRSLHMSVRDSLKKVRPVRSSSCSSRRPSLTPRSSPAQLRTDWIDLLYVHWWDWTTSIKEVMDSLHILVEQGKVHYLGVSGAFLAPSPRRPTLERLAG